MGWDGRCDGKGILGLRCERFWEGCWLGFMLGGVGVGRVGRCRGELEGGL